MQRVLLSVFIPYTTCVRPRTRSLPTDTGHKATPSTPSTCMIAPVTPDREGHPSSTNADVERCHGSTKKCCRVQDPQSHMTSNTTQCTVLSHNTSILPGT